jgi:hypothetical protein
MVKEGRITDRGVMDSIAIESDETVDHFGYVFETVLKIEDAGLYMFQITTDDGAVMMIDGKEVFNRDGSHSTLRGWAAVNMEKGLHKVTIRYFDDSEGQTLDVYMVAPDGYEGPIPAEICYLP